MFQCAETKIWCVLEKSGLLFMILVPGTEEVENRYDRTARKYQIVIGNSGTLVILQGWELPPKKNEIALETKIKRSEKSKIFTL